MNSTQRAAGRNRLRNLSVSEESSDHLLDLGFTSSYEIAQSGEANFLNCVKSVMGEPEARKTFAMARHKHILTENLIVALKTSYGSQYYRALRFSGAEKEGKLKGIPSYQEIFGELEYCACEHCRSIFGPTAYFVDLLRIVTTPKYFVFQENAVKFEERRVDLLKLMLTCENANNTVPYLQIVNQVLGRFVTGEEKTREPFRKLASDRHPHNLPFLLPAAQIRFALEQRAGWKLIELMDTLHASPRQLAREYLGVTSELFDELAKEIPEKDLPKYYAVKAGELAGLSVAASFLRATGLRTGDLYDLIYRGAEEGDERALSKLFINRSLPAGGYIALYEEDGVMKIKNLNAGGLERIYRFLKLSRSLALTLGETELALRAVNGGESDISEAILLSAAEFVRFSCESGFALHPLAVILGAPIPTAPGDPATTHSLALEFSREVGEVKNLAVAVLGGSDEPLPAKSYAALWRHLTLAGLLSLSVEDYVTFMTCMGLIRADTFQLNDVTECAAVLTDNVIQIRDLLLFTEHAPPPTELITFVKDMAGRLTAEKREAGGDFLKTVILEELSSFMGIEPDDLFALVASAAPERQETVWLTGLLTDTDAVLTEKLRSLRGLAALYQNDIFLPVIRAVAKHPAVFGEGEASPRTLARVSAVNTLTAGLGDNEFALAAFLLSGKAEETLAPLAELMRFDLEQLQALYKRLSVSSPVRAELLLSLCRAVRELRGANLDLTLAYGLLDFFDCKEAAYDTLMGKADGYLAVLGDSDVLRAIEGVKREALLSRALFLLHNKMENVETAEELYKHFLIDAQMDEQTEISPIKEGINAVQLYLQRCRLGLEEGVLSLNIHENWWSWLLDYTMWEANRKIFVYPENYLLPALRTTKTSLFNRLMENLNQGPAGLGEAEGEYVTYLEDFERLTRLTVCSAYAAVIHEEDTLFLFARTRIKPYRYYTCRQVDNMAWTEWEEIDETIESDTITPVYVFDRLYLFWSDLSRIDKGGVGNKESDEKVLTISSKVVTTARMKYTYKNLRGKWILPQTLIEDEIAYYHDNKEPFPEKEGDKSFAAAFTEGGDYWKMPLLIRVRRNSVQGYADVPADYERLLVLVGPCVASLPRKLTLYTVNPAADPDKKAFLTKLNRMVAENNFLYDSGKSGFLSAGFAKLYDMALEETYISHDTEFALLESYTPYPPNGGPAFRPVRDKVHKIVGAAYTGDILLDALAGKRDVLLRSSYGSPAEERVKLQKEDFPHPDVFSLLSDQKVKVIADGYADVNKVRDSDLAVILSPLIEKVMNGEFMHIVGASRDVLLRNAGALYAFTYPFDGGLIPVNNRPGWFVFDVRDEAFLVYPAEAVQGNPECPVVLTAVDDGLRIGDPPLTVPALTQAGVMPKIAEKIVRLLNNAKLLDECGVPLRYKCGKEAVYEALSADPATKLYDYEKAKTYCVIQNLPQVSEILFHDLFEQGSDMPAKIFRTLEKAGVLVNIASPDELPDYRLDLIVYKLPPNLARELGDDIGGAVYARLSALPVSVTLRYEDRQSGFKPLTGRKFAVRRLMNNSIGRMQSKLLRRGINGFLTLETQFPPKEPILPFKRLAPNPAAVISPKTVDGAQIDFEGLYGEYNWELFYHIPMAMAATLISGFDSEGAANWFHYVFNPTKQKQDDKFYWNFLPFCADLEEKLVAILKDPAALTVYNNHPFNPHAIARLRIGAYEKYTVIEYIAGVIRAGDGYFIQNTWEGITAATMMYVLAADLLGKRPEEKKIRQKTAEKTFEQIRAQSGGEVPQIIIELEDFIQKHTSGMTPILDHEDILMSDHSLYFQIPENEQLTKCWDLVEDRLFKLRHSLGLDGNPRALRLFEAPLYPLSAVSSFVAHGEGSGGIVMEGALFPYRYQYVAERAKSLVSQLISLSALLLSAIEKKDAEALIKLSRTQELVILDMMSAIRQQQIDEAAENIEALKKLKAGAEDRKAHYEKLVKENISEKEQTSLDAAAAAFSLATTASVVRTAAGVAHLVPQVGSPFAMTYGGVQVGASLSAAASVIELGASISSYISGRSLTMAGYDRRREDWSLQVRSITTELENLEKQLEAASIRKKITERELLTHKKTIEHNKQVLDHIKNKFSREDLYQWLVVRLSATMWQTYQLALSLSLAAEKAYQYERDLPGESFVRFDYWDSGRKGIFVGEALQLSLAQMDAAYLKGNTRRLEIEKNVSLALCCPEAFLRLKSEGTCEFKLQELLFAGDYPGLYCRKIKSVSISIPAVMPPYQTFKAILRLTESKVLLKPDKDAADYLLGLSEKQPEAGTLAVVSRGDSRIAISGGIDDSGMFRLNFDDERYLPFEGCGAMSKWSLSMPKEMNDFDFDTISDVILNIKYTALEDEAYGAHVSGRLKKLPWPGGLHYRLGHAYPAQWRRFREEGGDTPVLRFRLDSIPVTRFQSVALAGVLFKIDAPFELGKPARMTLAFPGLSEPIPVAIPLTRNMGVAAFKATCKSFTGDWELGFDLGGRSAEQIRDVEMILIYHGTL